LLLEELLAFVSDHFSQVQSGSQGDSWIWISDYDKKVAIDTFSFMKHQIKSDVPGKHVGKIIEILRLKYPVKVYDTPALEAHG
jgi:hypothetical protein